MKTLKLKTAIRNEKFGITWPANTESNFYIDFKNNILVEHPVYKNCYTQVLRENVKNLKSLLNA